MNNSLENHGGDPLTKLLQEWKPDATLPAGFQTSVWNRIDTTARKPTHEATFGEILRMWLDQFVARPELAFAYVVFLVMVGMTAGWTRGQREVARVQEGLAHRYVQTLDPYQIPRGK